MKAVIYAAGLKPSNNLLRSVEGDLCIAVDGAAAYLNAAGIVPDLLIGDFDSAKEEDVRKMRAAGVKVIALSKEKDDTDTFFAVKQALLLGANEIVLIGCYGGRMDHTLANLLLPIYALNEGATLTLITEDEILFAATGGVTVPARKGDTVSVFSLESAKMKSSRGLFYPLNGLELSPLNPIGISNVAVEDFPEFFTSEIVLVSVLRKAECLQ